MSSSKGINTLSNYSTCKLSSAIWSILYSLLSSWISYYSSAYVSSTNFYSTYFPNLFNFYPIKCNPYLVAFNPYFATFSTAYLFLVDKN